MHQAWDLKRVLGAQQVACRQRRGHCEVQGMKAEALVDACEMAGLLE